MYKEYLTLNNWQGLMCQPTIFTVRNSHHRYSKHKWLQWINKNWKIMQIWRAKKMLFTKLSWIHYSVWSAQNKSHEQWLCSSSLYCPVGWGCRIHRLLLCRRVRLLSNECPVYDTKQSEDFSKAGALGNAEYCHHSQVHSGPEW